MKRVIKLIILKSSMISFAILLSVSAAPTGNKFTTPIVDSTDLKLARYHNQVVLKRIDYAFQRRINQ